MGIEENKAIVHRLVGDFLNKHDLSVADEIFADDLIDHQAAITATRRANVKQFVAGLFEAFPDLRCEITHLIGEGHNVCVNVIGRGTHRGEFRGVAPTGPPGDDPRNEHHAHREREDRGAMEHHRHSWPDAAARAGRNVRGAT